MDIKNFMEIMAKANYYSQTNDKKGWNVEINNEIIISNPNVITPEIAEVIKTDIQPKESFLNVINNYDEKTLTIKKNLDEIIMTKQENYGRGMAA